MFAHVTREEIGEGNKLHISHLHRYVSAYHPDPETVKELVKMIEEGLKKAKKTKQVVMVDQDGEFCFHVYPSGAIELMIPWKRFVIVRGE